MAQASSIIFISGGVRSGKSRFAETTACQLAEKNKAKLHYIAAGQASDAEMKIRITRHRQDRLESGFEWTTWEQPVGLEELSDCFSSQDIVLLDCLTTLLNNEFFQGNEKWASSDFRNDVMTRTLNGIKNIGGNCKTLIIVSNEVLYDVLLEDELVLTYKKMLGVMHQQIVALANEAYLVEAGIPLLMKGVS